MPPTDLTILAIERNQRELDRVAAWPFPTTPFYVGQISRLIRIDLAQRIAREPCRVWLYKNANGEDVGFSSLAVATDLQGFTDGQAHLYVPVLSAHPNQQGKGYGTRIVQHLIQQAAELRDAYPDLPPYLFLDVYTENTGAIRLYTKHNFDILSVDAPLYDSQENDEPYHVMAFEISFVD